MDVVGTSRRHPGRAGSWTGPSSGSRDSPSHGGSSRFMRAPLGTLPMASGSANAALLASREGYTGPRRMRISLGLRHFIEGARMARCGPMAACGRGFDLRLPRRSKCVIDSFPADTCRTTAASASGRCRPEAASHALRKHRHWRLGVDTQQVRRKCRRFLHWRCGAEREDAQVIDFAGGEIDGLFIA